MDVGPRSNTPSLRQLLVFAAGIVAGACISVPHAASEAVLGGHEQGLESSPVQDFVDNYHFHTETFVSGLDSPTSMAFAKDGRVFVAEKDGALRVVLNGGLLDQPFADLEVKQDLESGLLGVALDPAFEENGHVYVYYSAIVEGSTRRENRVTRLTASAKNPNAAADGSETVILDGIPFGSRHNGGALHFGPDGMLYVATGEAGRGELTSQSLLSLGGKLLRIGMADDGTMFIPDDNPFIGTEHARPEILTSGHRNPFTFAIDPGTSDIFVNDVGSMFWEEINLIEAGANYGWPYFEGHKQIEEELEIDASLYTFPLYSYERANEAASITGGVFIRSDVFPASIQGHYAFGDYLRGSVWILDEENGQAFEVRLDYGGFAGTVDLDINPVDDHLYVLNLFDGVISRLLTSSVPFPSPVPTPLPTSTAIPEVTPTPARPGDVNCDGRLSSIDAVLLLQRTAGLIASMPCDKSGDVDGDGVIRAVDAALILQHEAGLIDI